MVFNSLIYLVFFSIVLFLHNLPISWQWKKINLICLSYLFYAAWNPPYVILLWVSTLVDWFIVKRLSEAKSVPKRKRLLWVSIGVNLGMLLIFKYGEWLVSSLLSLFNLLDLPLIIEPPHIILPIGISFYTFMTLSYSIDVYYKKTEPCKSFTDYALFLTFFPHLVSGPIVRASEFLHQCEQPRKATKNQFGWGLYFILCGLFQKIVIADRFLAPIVDDVYNQKLNPDFISAWSGTIAFSGQILCDFAGYTLCAIGSALCLGFIFPRNFQYPYAAVGFSDFWRRWHISLSTWLRDYLYIPLGGNRKGEFRTYLNLMITMLLGGLWHGASWMFIIWGGLHGILLAVERLSKKIVPSHPFLEKTPVLILKAFLTYLCVCVTWVFFRAQNIGQSFLMSKAMFGVSAQDAQRVVKTDDLLLLCVLMTTILAIHWFMRNTTLEKVTARIPTPVRIVGMTAMIVLIILSLNFQLSIYTQYQ